MLRHTGRQRRHAATLADAAMQRVAAPTDGAAQQTASTADVATVLVDRWEAAVTAHALAVVLMAVNTSDKLEKKMGIAICAEGKR